MTFLKPLIITCVLLLWTPMSFAETIGSGTGTVAETMTSGGYVYVRLAEDNVWVASTPIPVSVGDKVKYMNAMMMKEFRSRTLNRDFEDIWFTAELEIVNPVNAASHADTATADQLGIARSDAAVAPEAGEIALLVGGKTISNIYTEAQQLQGQQVKLRARVMKVSKNILGKNWITLQDGTGKAPENVLLATSEELVEVGDLVKAEGVVNTDVDLGSGYTYKVVIEKTSFSK